MWRQVVLDQPQDRIALLDFLLPILRLLANDPGERCGNLLS